MAPKRRTKGTGPLIQSQRREPTPDISSSSQGQPAEVIEFRGLPTLQNWCYVNSVFQAFLHAPKFVNWLTQDHANCAIEECLGCALRDLSTSYWTDPLDWHALEIAHFMLRRALRKSFKFEDVEWNWRRQQDAAEFYLHIIDALKERDPEIGPVIDALFKFDIINTRICPNCGNKVGKVESNTSLHVQFEDGAPLEDILRSVTFGPSIYSDRRCEVCYTYMNTPNVPQLATGPDILVMQLARFTNWGESESGKNEAVIPFDEELDLSPYTHETFGLNYRLLSVVQHCGSRAHGHYITIAKGESGGWEKLDDTSASPADGIDPFCPKDEADFTPYILFWARVDEDVAAESPTDDETASTNDDGDGDDELQPLQISINGILQPPSEQYFVRMSLLVVLDQQRIEEISANIYTAWSEIEMGGREKNEEEEEEQDEDEDEGEEDDEDEKKEDEERKGKKNKEGDEEKKGGKITKKDLKKEEEKKKEQAKKELKELKTSIQKDSRKVNDETQKVQEKTKKGEKSIEEKKTDEEGEEDEEKEKRGISKKRKSSGHDSTSREESISVLKKQKSSNDNSPSQKKKRTKGGLKKK